MSKYTKEEILKSAQENGVEFIRLQFTDVFGIMKNVAITSSQLEKALDNECAVKLKKFTSASAGTAKVTYNKAAKATGYQIQYADNASFKSAKTANVNGGSVTSKTIKRLTKGKRYYVRVRSFKKIDGKVYYSAWCGKKSVVIKKR